uniref:apoptosis-inducing factor 2-like n=1 Tax=Ciona intestinalis TaxID=7719 RepID=UPI000180B813|nr:apoptosis-inducing factor 2-like [Ciona intestinalis]|eukprot:XP_002126981.1 apoptosis-inducing factor 2-like [Ciona intestinalis]
MGLCNSIEFQSDMHLVIVGGGYGGSHLALQMIKANICKVTLIDPRDAMFHSIGALRATVDDDYMKNLFLPYESMIGDSFMRGYVENIDTKSKILILKDGRTVAYTHLVIAVGSRSNFPSNLSKDYPDVNIDEGKEIYTDYREEIMKSRRIVLVGGGAVGVELAGEIKTDYPDKSVTIVSSTNYLVSSRTKTKFQRNLLNVLRAKEISVILDERVSNLDELIVNQTKEGQIVITEKGSKVDADLIIPCTGTRVNNKFFQHEMARSINAQGALKVNSYLQVKGHEEVIWALGDVTDVKEEKLAYHAQRQAEVLAANFKADTTNSNRKQYKTGPFVIFVSVGRNDGVGQMFGVQVGSKIVKKVKGKDLLARKTWQVRGMTLPVT